MDKPVSNECVVERRTNRRFRIQAPAVAKIAGREIGAFASDMSASAVYFRTAGDEQKPSVDESLDFVIKLPPSMNYSKPRFIKGRGRTLRIDDLAGNETGVVVALLEYDIETESAHNGAATNAPVFWGTRCSADREYGTP